MVPFQDAPRDDPWLSKRAMDNAVVNRIIPCVPPPTTPKLLRTFCCSLLMLYVQYTQTPCSQVDYSPRVVLVYQEHCLFLVMHPQHSYDQKVETGPEPQLWPRAHRRNSISEKSHQIGDRPSIDAAPTNIFGIYTYILEPHDWWLPFGICTFRYSAV